MPILEAAGFQKNLNCFSLGSPSAKSIEGLLPESITRMVQSNQPDVITALTFGDKKQKASAKNSYKRALLDEFKRSSKPTDEYFKGFYPIIKNLNKAFNKK